jgi:hypothetical protein
MYKAKIKEVLLTVADYRYFYPAKMTYFYQLWLVIIYYIQPKYYIFDNFG